MLYLKNLIYSKMGKFFNLRFIDFEVFVDYLIKDTYN